MKDHTWLQQFLTQNLTQLSRCFEFKTSEQLGPVRGNTFKSTSTAHTPRCFFQQRTPLDSGDGGTEPLLGLFVKPQQHTPTGCLAYFQLTGTHKLHTTLSVARAMAQVQRLHFFSTNSLPTQSFMLRFLHHLSAVASSTHFFQRHSICYALCSLLSSLVLLSGYTNNDMRQTKRHQGVVP